MQYQQEKLDVGHVVALTTSSGSVYTVTPGIPEYGFASVRGPSIEKMLGKSWVMGFAQFLEKDESTSSPENICEATLRIAEGKRMNFWILGEEKGLIHFLTSPIVRVSVRKF